MSDDEQHQHNFEQVRPSPIFRLRHPPSHTRPSYASRLPPEPRSPSPCNARPFARTATSSSRVSVSPSARVRLVTTTQTYSPPQAAPARSSTCRPPRPASTVTPRSTWSPSMYACPLFSLFLCFYSQRRLDLHRQKTGLSLPKRRLDANGDLM